MVLPYRVLPRACDSGSVTQGDKSLSESDSITSATRVCTKCGRELPATREFFYAAYSRLRGDCKRCISDRRRAYQSDNRERIAERKRAHYVANSAKIAAKNREYYGCALRGNCRVSASMARRTCR